MLEQPFVPVHVPVMVEEVLQGLAPLPGRCVVDGTIGAGGHARRIAEMLAPRGHLIGLDRDAEMLELARPRVGGCRVTLIQANYASLRPVLDELGIAAVDGVLLDLGMCSDQLASPGRGFSFHDTGPLDLRFDREEGEPASGLLNRSSAEQLSEIFRSYGEERFARRIARRLVQERRQGEKMSAEQLADLIWRAVPPAARRGKIHPATRVFQALRIAVNEELQSLSAALEVMPHCLVAGGRLVVISFHSLEDRMVKQALRDPVVWEVLTKRPLRPTGVEVQANPRSRSAKLRAACRRS